MLQLQEIKVYTGIVGAELIHGYLDYIELMYQGILVPMDFMLLLIINQLLK